MAIPHRLTPGGPDFVHRRIVRHAERIVGIGRRIGHVARMKRAEAAVLQAEYPRHLAQESVLVRMVVAIGHGDVAGVPGAAPGARIGSTRLGSALRPASGGLTGHPPPGRKHRGGL